MSSLARRTSLFDLPGGLMLHPLVFGCVCVTALNDHWLKTAYAGFVSGKPSDFAGLVFFPPMLASIAS